jgi:hypothetical protein
MGVVALVAATDANGKPSTAPDVWTPDTVVEKPFIFSALKNGTFQGVAYNFNTDIFTLLGRSQSTLSGTECVQTVPTSTGMPSSTGSGSTTGSNGSTGSQTSTSENQQNNQNNESSASFLVSSLALVIASILLNL